MGGKGRGKIRLTRKDKNEEWKSDVSARGKTKKRGGGKGRIRKRKVTDGEEEKHKHVVEV